MMMMMIHLGAREVVAAEIGTFLVILEGFLCLRKIKNAHIY